MLMSIAVMVPLMCVGMGLAIQGTAEGTGPPAPGQLERRLLSQPVMLVGVLAAAVLAAVAGMVYWVANCIVVAERDGVVASWRRSLRFCRENAPAVLAVWLVNLAAGVVLSPLGLLGQLGVVTDPWVLAALALVYSALIGYWGVVTAGMSMSLYLGRRTESGWGERKEGTGER